MRYDIDQRSRRWAGRHHDLRWYAIPLRVGRWMTMAQAEREAAERNRQIIAEAAGKAGRVKICRMARAE